MSDEYGASSGYGGSLVNKSAGDSLTTEGEHRAVGEDYGGDYAMGNYPPAGDSTASGGYGSRQSPWDASRHSGAHTPARTGSGAGTPGAGERGLIDQSTSGGSLGDTLGDARQGRDEGAQEAAGRERAYGESWEGREEAREALAARYRGGTEGAR